MSASNAPGQTVRLGDFDVEISVFTTDASEHRAVDWSPAGEGWRAAGLRLAGEPTEPLIGTARIEPFEPTAGAGAARFRLHVEHQLPVKAVRMALDLPALRMLAPEEIELEDYVWRQWDFPRDWRTGFAVWEAGERFFTVVTHDKPWHFKRLRALRRGSRMRLEVVQDASLRDRTRTFRSSIWGFAYRDRIDPLLDDYARFVEQAFGAAPFDGRPDVPDWLPAVGLVVNLHGLDWRGRRNLDFAAMTRVAETLAGLFDPRRTILYPIGWDGRYMRNYPDYRPAPELGGEEGFAAFCRRARGLGFHLMPHLNAMAVNMRHPLYLTHLKDYCLRDASGEFQRSHRIDWDQDGLGDAAHAYIALEPPALREILVARIGELVERAGVDAVFLDETCNVFYNDPAWDQAEGVRRLVRDVHARWPRLLIAGEEWNEMLLGLTPLVQVWEETSDGRRGFGRARSPLMRRWAARFIRGCGYLALATPDGTTGVHEWPDRPWVEERANEAFYVPTLAVGGRTMERAMQGIHVVVERARDYVQRFTVR